MLISSQKSLLRKIDRLNSLFNVFRRAAHMSFEGDDHQFHYASSRMDLQVKYIVGQGILTLEAEILKNVDKLLFTKGINCENPLATRTCLWLLILTYKEQMSYIYFHYLCDDRVSVGTMLKSSAKISQISILYLDRQNTSLTRLLRFMQLYSRQLPHSHLTGALKKSQECLETTLNLVKLFCNIKTEMFWFRECCYSQ